jgi:hypothetical protein
MPQRESPDGLHAEPVDGWVHVYGPYASTTLSPEAAVKTAERLLLAAEEAMEQRGAKQVRSPVNRRP